MTVTPVTDWFCPECGVSLEGRRYYGPCADCSTGLRVRAERRHEIWSLMRFIARTFHGRVL